MSCYRDLRPGLVATLAAGLGPDSRIYQRASGLSVPFSMYLQALQIDLLRVLIWQNTEDGHKNRNKPESISEKFRTTEEKTVSFDAPEDFEKFRAAILEGGD